MKSIKVISAISFSSLVVLGCAHFYQAQRVTASAYQNQIQLVEDADDQNLISVPMGSNSAIFGSQDRPNPAMFFTGIFSNSDTPTVAQLIRKAHSTVDIEIYEMADPDVRQAIRQALSKNIRVRIIKEPMPIGQKCNPWGEGLTGPSAAKAKPEQIEECLDQQKLVKDVKTQSGGAFEPFNKVELCGQQKKQGRCYQHGKMVIVDQELALLSTGNFNASNLCDLVFQPDTCNRDYSYITRDLQVVKALETIFEKDLAGRRYDLTSILDQPGISQKITVSPFSLAVLTSFVAGAPQKSLIQIQNQYINPDSGLAEVLIKKAKEGSQIEVQLTDVCNYGKVPEKKAYQLYLMYSAMENAGIKIRMFGKNHRINGKPGYLHAKAIVINKQRAWMGSVNGSSTSLNQNREFGIFFNHPARVQAFSEYLSRDFSDPTSQPWRDSLLCHHVGYQSAEVVEDKTPQYKTFIEGIRATNGNGSGLTEDNEEE